MRVERYAMPGGGSQAAVYIAGTQTISGGSGDPFDMRSNLELYGGERSASLESVELALREAGVAPLARKEGCCCSGVRVGVVG